jgi:hypothetical protein
MSLFLQIRANQTTKGSCLLPHSYIADADNRFRGLVSPLDDKIPMTKNTQSIDKRKWQ